MRAAGFWLYGPVIPGKHISRARAQLAGRNLKATRCHSGQGWSPDVLQCLLTGTDVIHSQYGRNAPETSMGMAVDDGNVCASSSNLSKGLF